MLGALFAVEVLSEGGVYVGLATTVGDEPPEPPQLVSKSSNGNTIDALGLIISI